MIASINYDALADFVMARRKISGGFGATPLLPPTVEDTFHAIGCLEALPSFLGKDLLSDCRADQELNTYLKNQLPVTTDLGIKSCYQLLKTCSVLGMTIDEKLVRSYIKKKIDHSFSLLNCFYAMCIYREILNDISSPLLTSTKKSALLPGRMTCEEMMMYIDILSFTCSGSNFAFHDDQIAWFRGCQNSDGGFGFFKGTTSFIENCFFCLRALSLLKADPKNPTGASLFIAGCQTNSGGFGRSHKAAPFLDATWFAIKCLSMLFPAGPH